MHAHITLRHWTAQWRQTQRRQLHEANVVIRFLDSLKTAADDGDGRADAQSDTDNIPLQARRAEGKSVLSIIENEK